MLKKPYITNERLMKEKITSNQRLIIEYVFKQNNMAKDKIAK
jgi:hypothetical protein